MYRLSECGKGSEFGKPLGGRGLRLCLMLVYFVFHVHCICAQPPVFKVFDTEAGLPSNFVYKVFQDSKGLIWFATNNGVARYDGLKVDKFGAGEGVLNPDVWYFFEDSKCRIWLCTYSGSFYFYSYDDETFHSVENPFDKGFSQPISGFFEANDGTIVTSWISKHTDNGIQHIYYKISPELVVTRHQSVHPENKYRIHVNYQPSSSFYFNFQQGGFTLVDKFHAFCDHVISITNGNIFCFYDENKQEVVLETKSLVQRKRISDMHDSGNNLLWINILNDSTLCFRFENKVILTDIHLNRLSKYAFIEKSGLRNVTIDNQNNIWSITNYNGVDFYSSTHLNVQWLGTDFFKNSTQIQHIASAGQHIYFVATSDGVLYEIIRKADKAFTVKKLYTCNGYIRRMVLNQKKDKLIFILSDDYWNIGVIDVHHKKAEIGAFSKYKYCTDSSGVKLYHIENFKDIQCNQDHITISGVFKIFMFKGDDMKHVQEVYSKNRTITSCFDKANQLLWLGGPGGVRSYRMKTKAYNNFSTLIPADRIILDNKNRPWFISGNRGIYFIDDQKLVRIKEINSLIIHDIQCFGNSYIWAYTDKGLYCIHSDNLSVRPVPLTGDKSIFSLSIEKNEKLFIGSDKGVMIVDTTLHADKHTCNPLFEDIILGEHRFFENPDQLTGDVHNNDLNLRVMIPCYYTNKFHVLYKMEAYDEAYSQSYDHRLTYKKLPSGHYNLHVMISENGSSKIIGERKLKIVIKQHWSETILFRVLLAVLILFFIAAGYYWYGRYLRKKNRIKLKMERLMANQKLEALQHQLNPHFIFNVLNSIQSFIMKKDTLGANHYLNRFSKLMRYVLESSRHLYIPIKLEIEILNTYLELEKLRYGDKFSYIIHYDDNFDLTREIPSMVIQPFVENAIKHGMKNITHAGLIQIAFSGSGRFLKVTVTDNGNGFREEQVKLEEGSIVLFKGRGLQITKERVAAYSQQGYCTISFTIDNVSEKDPDKTGTCVTIFIEILH